MSILPFSLMGAAGGLFRSHTAPTTNSQPLQPRNFLMKRQLFNDIRNFDLDAVECRTNFDKESPGRPFTLSCCRLQVFHISGRFFCSTVPALPLSLRILDCTFVPSGGSQPNSHPNSFAWGWILPQEFLSCTVVSDLCAHGCVHVRKNTR